MENNNDEKYNERFRQEREEWKEKIQVLSSYLKDIKTVAIAQIELFSYRQILLEYSHELAIIISKLNTKYRKEKKEKLIYHTEAASNYRYGANEKNTLIEGDLSKIIEKIELVENHRKFIEQTIQTIDHMLYSIKNRIALEDFLRGSTIK